MNFINLHAHSKYSDGKNTLEEHMFAQRKLGFSAVVLTDHVYVGFSYFSLNHKTFQDEVDEAKSLEDKYGVPFIIGIECSCMRLEEVNVFGYDAIKEIMKIIEHRSITADELVSIKENNECVINMNHPMHPSKFIENGCMKFLDGVEYIHASRHTFDKTFSFPEEFKSIVKLCNSDAHSTEMLSWCYNQSEEPITTEKELISYIKNRREFKHIINLEDRLPKNESRNGFEFGLSESGLYLPSR